MIAAPENGSWTLVSSHASQSCGAGTGRKAWTVDSSRRLIGRRAAIPRAMARKSQPMGFMGARRTTEAPTDAKTMPVSTMARRLGGPSRSSMVCHEIPRDDHTSTDASRTDELTNQRPTPSQRRRPARSKTHPAADGHAQGPYATARTASSPARMSSSLVGSAV